MRSLAVLLCAAASFAAGERSTPLFGGGMGYQAGYVSCENRYREINGIMMGLGGRLHFYFGPWFRIGGAGASVQLSYENNDLDGSYIRIGYGGLTVEGALPIDKWRISAGLLAGGGGFHNLHLLAVANTIDITAMLDERASFILSPLLTVEWSLTKSLALMLMADYLYGPKLGDKKHLGGPKVHIGVLFAR